MSFSTFFSMVCYQRACACCSNDDGIGYGVPNSVVGHDVIIGLSNANTIKIFFFVMTHQVCHLVLFATSCIICVSPTRTDLECISCQNCTQLFSVCFILVEK